MWPGVSPLVRWGQLITEHVRRGQRQNIQVIKKKETKSKSEKQSRYITFAVVCVKWNCVRVQGNSHCYEKVGVVSHSSHSKFQLFIFVALEDLSPSVHTPTSTV